MKSISELMQSKRIEKKLTQYDLGLKLGYK